MSQFDRRRFLRSSAAAALAAGFCPRTGRAIAPASQPATTTQPATATRPARGSDTVLLGKTGIRTSRLAIGTGTDGGRQQRELGPDGFNKLLRHGLDQGVRWWDTADTYKTHALVAATLREVKREEVVITSKTWAREKTPDGVREDIERFRKQLNTDYIDVLLLHCMEDPQWPEKMKGHMDVLSEAKQKGWIRAVGVSCHTLGALQAAANEPWVEVDLARLNPFAHIMDVKTADEINKVEHALTKMHTQGKAVYAMKVIGNGHFKGDKIEQSVRYALSKPYVTSLNIGFTSTQQIDEILAKMERVRV